jgi:hypothetical protein
MEIIKISPYKSESILTSKSASIEAKAPEIHHRTMLHAIHQKMMAMNKLVHENRIFCSCFLCNNAIISGIQSNARGIIRK